MKETGSSTRRFFKELRFQQLRALVELVGQTSFAGAAHTLGLATPSAWQQIRGLEVEFGVELVRVNGKTVELTDDGTALADLARPLVAGFDSLHEAFEGRTNLGPKRLVLASRSSCSRTNCVNRSPNIDAGTRTCTSRSSTVRRQRPASVWRTAKPTSRSSGCSERRRDRLSSRPASRPTRSCYSLPPVTRC
ncbi:MAG: LysR family transcriptional regulator [Planctomycetes bacterium]|nr:LysR family transcriptional regulator [Planctomycetota bacterium]